MAAPATGAGLGARGRLLASFSFISEQVPWRAPCSVFCSVFLRFLKTRHDNPDIFRWIWARHNTGWHVTIRVAWLASVGGRAICPRPLLRAIPPVPRACIVDLKLASASASAYRRSRGVEHAFDLGDWASRDFTEVPTRRPASTELEPSEPDRAPDLIGAYGRRTSNTNHVPFAPFCIERVSGASAPECGVAGGDGGDGCHVGRPATIWDLRSAG